MLPELFSIGPFKFHSFGAMLALSFLTANYIVSKELERKRITQDVTGTVLMITIVLGVIGAKLFSILENLDAFRRDPAGVFFNAGGLTFYGGMILALIGNFFYLKSQKVSIPKFFDAAAPALMLAYGIGRVGCLLAGDGCYGEPCQLPWAMTYPNGYESTLAAQNPALKLRFMQLFPNQPVPLDIPVHPTPIYETLYSIAFFAILWRLRTEPRAAGWLFSVYVMLQAVGRFFVEFIRINDIVAFGLTQAQLISIGLFIAGAIGVALTASKGAPTETEEISTTNKKQPAKKRAAAKTA
ncbi:MAG: hypothetical protein HY22_14250 [[Candidatus Thermochlorobacteriaceae] bacterium GBChlB]|nr:MAG: hypothetical protein HY22_14250 [[Candidatus Thermochlorobacteriaceae] bacterium GBChlB]